MDQQTIALEAGDEVGARLDVFIAAHVPDLTRAQAQRLIEDGLALINGAPKKSNYKLRADDSISVSIPPPQPTEIRAEAIPLDVIYEDQDIMVINKAKGMTTHPAPGSPAGTLVNAILAHCKDLSGVGGVQRPGIVHRLDKDTSGLIVVAKNDKAHLDLQKQIGERTAGRTFLAIVWGDTPFEQAEADAPIGRHPTDRKRMAVIRPTDSGTPQSRPAKTEFRVLRRLQGMTLLEAKLQTGRTHQIRVHCSFMGHPVVGDLIYKTPKHLIPVRLSKLDQMELQRMIDNLKGQALHATRLSFRHPNTRQQMEFEAPPPQEMLELVTWMEEHEG